MKYFSLKSEEKSLNQGYEKFAMQVLSIFTADFVTLIIRHETYSV